MSSPLPHRSLQKLRNAKNTEATRHRGPILIPSRFPFFRGSLIELFTNHAAEISL